MVEEIIGVIGGTGLGDALAEELGDIEKRKVETPFGRPSGEILVGKIGKRRLAFINRHGPGHKLGPSEVPYAANIFALKKLGVHTLVCSGAVGSLREEIQPGELVIVNQFIDKTYNRKNTFFEGFGAVHCEMSEPVCGRLSEKLFRAAKNLDIKVHTKGTYVCMEGPQFSSRAEAMMHKGWGGDLIGMTAMPEAKLAREAQMCYAMAALVSDYDCWREQKEADKQTLLQEITANLQRATENCLKLIRAVLRNEEKIVDEGCGCRKSLELAVWTKEEQISNEKKKRLKVLFE